MRSCACGCDKPMDGKRPDALYATDKCRALASDLRRGVRRAGDLPAALYAETIPTAVAIPWAIISIVAGAALAAVVM